MMKLVIAVWLLFFLPSTPVDYGLVASILNSCGSFIITASWMISKLKSKGNCHQNFCGGKLISLPLPLELADQDLNPDLSCFYVGTNLEVSVSSFLSSATFG